MNWVFLDTIPWDYDADGPLRRPLGGSQSALCYLARALAQQHQRVWMLTGTTKPRTVGEVRCENHRSFCQALVTQPETVVVVLNGPAELGLQIRSAVPSAMNLILWTQHAYDEPAMAALNNSAVQAAWDRIVCVSQWQRNTFHERLGIPDQALTVLRNAVAPAFQGLFRDAVALETAKSKKVRLAYTSTPFRGLKQLLHCFPEIRREHPECELSVFSSMLVYDEPATQDPFQTLYEQCRSTPGIFYHGSLPQPELASRLAEVSVLAYPNTFAETSCISAIEALAAGAVVVTSDLGALPETCQGWARLIPPIGPHNPADRFEREFVRQIGAVIQDLTSDRAGFWQRQFLQASAIATEYEWCTRAAEWQEAARGWLRQ